MDHYEQEGSVRATVGGLPPDHGRAPVQTAVEANASKRNTGFPSMFSGAGAAATEKPSASTDKEKLDTSDPWAAYRSKSEKYNFNDDPLLTGSNKDTNGGKDERKDRRRHLRYAHPKNQI